jgi:hypothetical protein
VGVGRWKMEDGRFSKYTKNSLMLKAINHECTNFLK